MLFVYDGCDLGTTGATAGGDRVETRESPLRSHYHLPLWREVPAHVRQ